MYIFILITSDVGNVFFTEILVTFCKFVTSTAFATFPTNNNNAIQNKKGKSRSTFSGFQVKILMEIRYVFRIEEHYSIRR